MLEKRLLICGFGAFPGVAHNPSEAVVERLREDSWTPPGVAAHYAILPTTWAGAAPALSQAVEQSGAMGVLLTGVAAGATAFQVELQARNCASATAFDALGLRHAEGPVAASGAATLDCTAPIGAILAAIRAAGLPAELSSDAGDYLCNFTLYHLLADRRAGPPCGFLHLPRANDDPFGLDDLERAVKAAACAMGAALVAAPGTTNPRRRIRQ
jgi:pyroglutamyl-peptidase